MAANAKNMSFYSLYFYAGFILSGVSKHKEVVTGILKAKYGPDWQAKMEAAKTAYTTSVDKLAKEIEEADDATKKLVERTARLSHWRRSMEAAARNAPEKRQDPLLKAAGYGLGSPTNDVDLRKFLAVVKPLVEVREEEFRALQVREENLKYPAQTLKALEEGGTDVIKEKADVRVARGEMHAAHAVTAEHVDSVTSAVNQLHADALFSVEPGAPERLKAVAPLVALVDETLNEALTQNRKKAEEKPALSELTTELATTPSPQPAPAPQPQPAPVG